MNKTADTGREKQSLNIREVEVTSEPVEMYKILKFENMVGSGGEAKAAIAAGQVLLNGKVETQKRKKIVSGDIIEFGQEKIRIQLPAVKNVEKRSGEENMEARVGETLKVDTKNDQ